MASVARRLTLPPQDHVVAKKKVVDDVYKYKKDLAEVRHRRRRRAGLWRRS